MVTGVTQERSAGFTLIEMMVVVAVVGLLLGAATMTFRNVTRSDLRSAASRTAAALRVAFDRTTMTGETVRVALDLEKGEYWLESSSDRVALRKGVEQHATTGVEGKPKEEKKSRMPGLPMGLGKGGAEEGDGEGTMGIDTAALKAEYEADLQPVARPKARFAPLKGPDAKRAKLSRGITVDAVVTPRLTEPQRKGTAYVYFFPQGFAEATVVHIKNRSEEYYSVVMAPLTGQVKVYPCRYDLPKEFEVPDDRKRETRAQACDEVAR
ncbi:MAG: prepilin-type N-terminal cleavage/methylation domain-containing protein [Deltaproteobacteria bacterium]|nr:prepilin-type N-terminal cleavage/methylation domain-containing protein [Deltaproteobacteria bacterium]